MKISAVVGKAGWFLKVSGGQVKTCPADFHINIELSETRAATVVDELVRKHGIKADRLRPVGVSYACPLPGSQQQNRGRAGAQQAGGIGGRHR